jgi:hypothetical protein
MNIFGNNPYIKDQAKSIQDLSNQNLAQNVMPGIRSGATGAGQYGGTRQGIAEGVAAGNAQTGVNAATAGLFGNAYGQDQNFYTQQRGQDLQQAGLGANIYNQGNAGNLGIGTGQYSVGEQYQNAPLTALQQYSSTISPYKGINGTQAQIDTRGGGIQGVMGGALAGAQIGKNLGFGNQNYGYNMNTGYGQPSNFDWSFLTGGG